MDDSAMYELAGVGSGSAEGESSKKRRAPEAGAVLAAIGSDVKVKDVAKLQEVMVVVLKSVLSNTQQIRVLRSAVLRIFLFKAESVPITAMKEATTRWHAAAKELEPEARQEKLSSPHVVAWNALVKSTLAIADVDKKLRIQTYVDELTRGRAFKQLEIDVKVCRLAKAWDKAKVKLELSVLEGSKTDEAMAVMAEVWEKELRVRRLQGIAAPGQMEVLMQQYIEELKT